MNLHCQEEHVKVVLKPRKPISLDWECGKYMGEKIRIKLRLHVSYFNITTEKIYESALLGRSCRSCIETKKTYLTGLGMW